ncbi:MAG: hypothetical protein F4X60_09625, partial [Gemmatimonadetes bacterium]|nr:hypothetical protein [Gemmatimonadota bacterium]
MRVPDLVLVVALLAVAGCAADDAPEPVVSIWANGTFDDWATVPVTVTDPLGDAPPGSPVDLGAVSVQDDPRFIHLLIAVGDTVTVQGMPGMVEVVLDADGDPGTGGRYGGVDGADLVVVLSRQGDPMADRHGAGVGVRWVGADGPGEIEAAAVVGLLVSPTHASDRFEVRLERGAVTDGSGVVVGRLRYVRTGILVDETPVFRHRVTTEPGEAPPLLGADAVAPPRGAFRVVTWNVSDENFRDRPGAFQRVLAALAPDVVLLDEVYAEVTLKELASFGEGMGGAGLNMTEPPRRR